MSDQLKKTHYKSYFRTFHRNSQLAKVLFGKHSEIVILQIMKTDNENFLAELVHESHYKEGDSNG